MKRKIVSILLFGLFNLFVLITFTDFSVTATGWVKLHPASTTQKHNIYTKKNTGTFGGFSADKVKTGDKADDPVIPDGEYFVTFWVDGEGRQGNGKKDVEHKKKMKFVGGKMQGEIPLTLFGKITSAGVSYPE